jgi:hypothetical protein
MQGFRASEWGNEGFLKDDGKDGLRGELWNSPSSSSPSTSLRTCLKRGNPGKFTCYNPLISNCKVFGKTYLLQEGTEGQRDRAEGVG